MRFVFLLLALSLCPGCATIQAWVDSMGGADAVADNVEAVGNVAGLFWAPAAGISALVGGVIRKVFKELE